MKNNICPECGMEIAKNLAACACGWQYQHQTPQQNNYCCAYRVNGENCTAPGNLCPRPYGNGPWYCKQHFYARNS